MPANDRDSASLWDMAQAIRRIQQFTADASYDTYLESVFMQSAVERQLGILGEAARRVLIEFQQFHPEIDWRNAINLHNILVHRYDQSPGASSERENHLRPKHLHTDSHIVGDDIPGTRSRQKFEWGREADEYVAQCRRSPASFF
ncbi:MULTISPECIES: HepT-like ribonuclease domain-containing protein [unclassified Microcoleus]|uniref:HepT-like ribonuclease domain-containing protein n=2 Tax=Microcoleus TaxID=44471 RepID=UPI002FD32A3B